MAGLCGVLRVTGWVTLILPCLLVFPGEPGSRRAVYPGPEYSIRIWQTEEGLPENSATAMAQTPDGYLWFGTFNGLVRFNGQEFKVLTRANTPNLPSEAVVNCYADRRGRLWISTDRGLAYLDQQRWHCLGAEQGWTEQFVMTFAEDPDGRLYVGTNAGRVVRLHDDRVELLEGWDGITDGVVSCVIDRDSVLWAVHTKFFGRWASNHWERAAPAEAFHGLVVAAPARPNGIWVMDRDYLRKYVAGREVARFDGLPKIAPWTLYEDSRTNVWLVSYLHGMVRCAPDGTPTQFTSTNGLSHNSGRFVFEDRENTLWLGTSGGGLHRFLPRRFYNLGLASGLPEQVTKSICEVAPGHFAIGTFGGGTVQWEAGRPSRLTLTPQPNLGRYSTSLALDTAGRLWVGTYGDGLFVLRGQEARRIPAEQTAGPVIHALYRDGRGRMWIGGDAGAACAEGDIFTVYGPTHGLTARSIRCFAEDPRTGELWAGAYDGGLFRLQAGRFRKYSRADGLLSDQIYALAADADGTIWIGTVNGGLGRYREGRFSAWNESHGLPADRITCILDGGDDSLWLGSNRGVIRVQRAELKAADQGQHRRLRCDLFTVSDGLESVECAAGFQPAGLRDSSGRLWFCTLKGAAVIDPRQVRLNPLPPPVHVEQLLYHLPSAAVDGRRDAPASGGLVAHRVEPPFGTPIRLPAGSRRLEFHVAGLSYRAPEKMRFQVRLEGLDPAWVDLGSRRVAPYDNLTPGSYVFRARAANNDGVWNETGVALALVQDPFFWQTGWFRLLALLGFAGGVGGGVWVVQHGRFLRQAEKLEAERALAATQTRLRQINADLLKLGLDWGLQPPSLEAAFREVTQVASHAFNVERAGVWRFDAPAEHLVCDDLYERTPRRHSGGAKLTMRSYPRYFQALRQQRCLAAHEARQDPTTSEFREGYLEPLGITSMLDAPIRLRGEVCGVLRLEHVGRPRLWSPEEELFAGSVADLLALIIENRERRLAEEGMQEREERVRTIFDSVNDAIFVHDPATGEILDVNRRMCEMYGYSPAEAAQLTVGDLSAGAPPFTQAEAMTRLRQALTAGAQVFEWHAKDKRGRLFWVEVNMRRAVIGGQERILVAVRDIGERKQAQETRERLEAQLRQAQKMEAIGTLAGGIAHDFNNILAAIIPFAHLAKEDTLANPSAQESIGQILQAAERAKNLVRQILAFSRKSKPERSSVQLQPMVTEALQLLRSALPATIEIQAEVRSDTPSILGDATQIHQVLMNLCTNAQHAMHGRPGRLEVQLGAVTVEAQSTPNPPDLPAGSYARLSVIDNGCGMDAETVSRIFEPFFTTKAPGEGTGLGLAVVHGIVQDHDGVIQVESKPGKGTAFHVYFPAQASGAEDVPSEPTSAPVGHGEQILFVDDEEALCRVARRILERSGYRVAVHSNPSEALALFRAQPAAYALVFTDLTMPGLTGVDLALEILKIRPDTPVILASGHGGVWTPEAVRRLGLVDMVSKPISPSALAEAVDRALHPRTAGKLPPTSDAPSSAAT